jgi:hypothetical protein
MLLSKLGCLATNKLSKCAANRSTRFLALSVCLTNEAPPPRVRLLPQVQARPLSKVTARTHESSLNGPSAVNGAIKIVDGTNVGESSPLSLFTSSSVGRIMMDDLSSQSNKHMELPAHEFAMGCRFLHQTAMGNLSELKTMVQLVQTSSSLVNFRDYDRRTPLVSTTLQSVNRSF